MPLDVRGTPAWQVRMYLERLGGSRQPDGSYAGDGWAARLTIGEHRAFGLLVPRVVITLEGDPGTVAVVESALRLRVMRVGG
ncbi:MAG: hypothetical protein ACOY93_05295 [Bacillota bacterium]